MSFDPTTDARVKFRLDYQSQFFSDTGATSAATLNGDVKAFIESTGTYTVPLASGSTVTPALKHMNGQPVIQAPPGVSGFCFNVGQPAALVALLNNALTTLSGQAGTNYLTVLIGVAPSTDTIFLSKSSGSQFVEVLTGSLSYTQFSAGGTAIDNFDRSPFDGTSVRQYGFSIYPMAAGNGTKWIRYFCDGAGSKANTASAVAVDTSNDLYIGSISNAPGIYGIGGTLAYFLACSPNLTALEIFQCEAFYRAAYGLADPRAGFGYNVLGIANSFEENDVLPEAICSNISMPAANFFNMGYGGATTEQLTTVVYPGEGTALAAALTGAKPCVIYAREMTNSLNIDSGSAIATAMETFWQTLRTDHPALPVVVPSCLSRGTGTPTPTDPARNIANAAIRAAISGVSGVYLADDAADATIGPDGASNNTTYFFDNVHPSAAGCAIIAGIDGPVIATASAYGQTPIAAGTPSESASGGYASLAVTATGGSGSYTFQWYRSTTSGVQGSALSGATAATLTNTGLTIGATYYFTCVVGDSNGDTPSTSAQLAVTVTDGGVYPTAAQVLAPTNGGPSTFGPTSGLTGTVTLPPAAAVLSTATFGPAAGTAGTWQAPTTGQVEGGIAFGPAGSLTGTFAGGGGGGSNLNGTVTAASTSTVTLSPDQGTTWDTQPDAYAQASPARVLAWDAGDNAGLTTIITSSSVSGGRLTLGFIPNPGLVVASIGDTAHIN